MSTPINLKKLRDQHRAFKQAVQQEITKVVGQEKVTQLAQRYVSENADFTSRTGNLVRRTKAKVIKTRKGHVVRLTNRAKYAAAQDEGSGKYGPRRRPYPIKAKRKTLRFIGRSGNVVFRKVVLHPGVQPTRFLYHAASGVGRTLRGWILSAMKRAASRT